MSEFAPIELEIGGQQRIFEYETTEVNLYRCISSVAFNHAITTEYGTQRVYIFDHPNLLVFLSGMEVHGHTLKDKQMRKLATEMDAQVGWNARTVIEDRHEPEIEERYLRIATKALRREVLYLPKEWK